MTNIHIIDTDIMLRRASLLLRPVPNHSECLIKVENFVATITLTRPSRKNALGRTLLNELSDSIAFCHQNPEVRAMILTSSLADVFCAGADLKERKEMSADESRQFVDKLRSTFSAVEDLQIPTIAAIEGAALGGGLELAIAADIRVAGSNAKLGVPETGLAILPGAGGSQRLPRIVGLSHAKLLAFTGSPITAKRAAEISLINECVEAGTALQKATAIAEKIATNGPVAVHSVKQAMNEGFGLKREEAMAIERKWYEKVLATKDRLEGLAAFQEKRKPVYKGE